MPPQPDRPCLVATTPPEDAAGTLADVYAGCGLKRGGEAHILESQSLHPEGLRDHHRLYRTLMFSRSPLSRAEREMIAVVVSSANECFY